MMDVSYIFYLPFLSFGRLDEKVSLLPEALLIWLMLPNPCLWFPLVFEIFCRIVWVCVGTEHLSSLPIKGTGGRYLLFDLLLLLLCCFTVYLSW